VKRLLALLLLTLTTGCVSPSFTDSDYELKAGNTAKAMVSSVGSALLAADLAKGHKATEAYLSVLLGGAEKDALSVEGTFDSVQPPSARADDLRDQVDQLLSDATDGLAAMRIAVRRGQLDRLPQLAAPLHETLKGLEDLADRYA
jgi:ABC-type transporter Mla subunit MlaD